MIIRYATDTDTAAIVRTVQPKGMAYNTATHVQADVKAGRLLVAEEAGRLLGSCAIVPETAWGYTAIKRMCVYTEGRGVASALVRFVCSLGLGVVGATPWNDNPAMAHILEKHGFQYQYTFAKNYNFYKKSA